MSSTRNGSGFGSWPSSHVRGVCVWGGYWATSRHLFFSLTADAVAISLTCVWGKMFSFSGSWCRVPHTAPLRRLFVFLTDPRTKGLYILLYCNTAGGAHLPYKLMSHLIIRVFTVCHDRDWLLGAMVWKIRKSWGALIQQWNDLIYCTKCLIREASVILQWFIFFWLLLQLFMRLFLKKEHYISKDFSSVFTCIKKKPHPHPIKGILNHCPLWVFTHWNM